MLAEIPHKIRNLKELEVIIRITKGLGVALFGLDLLLRFDHHGLIFFRGQGQTSQGGCGK